MRANVQQRPVTQAEEVGLGPKKTFLVLFTVVGCIAILFPKIFYPMMVGPSAYKQDRGPPNLQKQERPPHLKDLIHPGMQERGRAIPPHPTVPIIERPGRPGGLPGNIERRPGSPLVPGQPGPNLRAATYQAQHQQQQKAASQSIIMPIYTFGIVAFFVFTIVKILLKKTNKDKGVPMESDPNFVEKVFKQGVQQEQKKKLVYTAIQGIIDATNQQLSEIERECAENNKEHSNSSNNINAYKTGEDERENDHEKAEADTKSTEEKENNKEEEVVTKNESTEDLLDINDDESNTESTTITEHDMEIEKRLNHLKEAMHIKSVENIENSDLKSIYLEGELPHDPKILVSATETETKTEKISQYPSVKDVAEDEAVILSGKMTISLISLASDEEKNGIVEDHTTTNNVA